MTMRTHENNRSHNREPPFIAGNTIVLFTLFYDPFIAVRQFDETIITVRVTIITIFVVFYIELLAMTASNLLLLI